MDPITRESLFNQVRAWMLEAGAIIRYKINEPRTVNMKSSPKDLVTEMDKEIEKFFSERIKRHYPGHLLLSEEGFGDQLTSLEGTVWIIDPIDGTMNFVHQKRNFAISIGIYYQGIGEIGFIFDVMANNLYSAMRGNGAFKNDVKLPSLNNKLKLSESILCLNHRWLCENNTTDEKVMQELVNEIRGSRTYGSAALEFAFVAEGVIDGYVTMRLEPWDIAAGKIIVNEVDGITTNIDGENVDPLQRTSIITCHPGIHEELVEEYLTKAKK